MLHNTNHRDREKRLSDICFLLNIEDTHTVNYAVRKLKTAGLVSDGRRGKEKSVSVTAKGKDACDAYREVRERLLVDAVIASGLDAETVSKVGAVLRLMSGQYDQAARAATAL